MTWAIININKICITFKRLRKKEDQPEKDV